MLIFSIFFYFASIFIGSGVSFAATHYISPTGSDSNFGTNAAPWATFSKAFSSMTAGDTLIIKNGTYNQLFTSPPNGTPSAYTTVKAENDGGVIITGGLQLIHTNAYLIFEGLRFQDSTDKIILGNHIKFLRTEFKGGCASGNCSNVAVGSNDYNDTAYILFEDVWSHGLGGRYNFQIFNSDYVILRRVVIRHDGGWTDTKGDPEAGINFYNTSNSLAENVIVIDSNLNYHSWMASFAALYNSNSGPHQANDNRFIGSMTLVGENVGLTLGDSLRTEITDSVFWDTKNGGISFGGSGTNSATINRVTIGRSKIAPSGDWMGGIGAWNFGAKTISNAVIANWITGSDLDGVSASYFDTYNNLNISAGTGVKTYNPQTNGLKYLPRVETGSNLSHDGSGGGQMSANIVSKIGISGSLYGETGYSSTTAEVLWPWPYEVRIKKEMCTDVGITRGFCANGNGLYGGPLTLTSYVWEYLGNACPTGVCAVVSDTTPPAAPSGLIVI